MIEKKSNYKGEECEEFFYETTILSKSLEINLNKMRTCLKVSRRNFT